MNAEPFGAFPGASVPDEPAPDVPESLVLGSSISEDGLVRDFVRCLLCLRNEYAVVAEYCRYNIKARNVVCCNCGLVYQNPRARNEYLTEYYRNDYRDQHGRRFLHGTEYRNAIVRFAESIVGLLPVGAAVLEVGCADAQLLTALLRLRPDVRLVGIEPDEQLAAQANAQKQITVLNGCFESISLQPEHFDLIIFKHVLEHFADPRAVLRQAREALRPSGLIYLEMPDIWQPYGNLDRWFFQEAHLYNFSARTLDVLCAQCGLSPALRNTDACLSYFCRRAAPSAAEFPEADDWCQLTAFLAAYRRKKLGTDFPPSGRYLPVNRPESRSAPDAGGC